MNKWLAFCAITAELGEKTAHKLQKRDTDGDGQISRAEYMTYKAKKHKKDDRV